jgi:transcriptional regulator with XRE-family HTH domain
MAGRTLIEALVQVRQTHGLSQAQLADKAGLSRMAVQKTEAGATDPKFSTLHEMARALGMELMLVPAPLRRDLEAFIHSGGRVLGQPVGVDAPRSVVDDLVAPRTRGRKP